MVRGATAPSLALLLAFLVALPFATAPTAADGAETPEPADRADHPFLAQLPPTPTSVRLWAQMSSNGDAFLTLQPTVLPYPYAPPPKQTDDPALVFETFRHITTSADTRELQYTSRPVHAAWNASFRADVPVTAEWLLSFGSRDSGTLGNLPPLLVTTTLKTLEPDGDATILATRSVRIPTEQDAGPTPVRVTLDPGRNIIGEGTRLVVELDWRWARTGAGVPARPPLVMVHPGSFVDLPLTDPVRILSLKERTVSDALYVRSQVAHLFGVENLALSNANLYVKGPSLSTQGGRPVVQARLDDGGHVATFDWATPVHLDRLKAGTYTFFVTAGQVEEAGPRAMAKGQMVLTRDPLVALEADAVPLSVVGLAGLATLGAGVAMLRRRQR